MSSSFFSVNIKFHPLSDGHTSRVLDRTPARLGGVSVLKGRNGGGED